MVFSHYASLAADGDKFSISLNSFHKFYVDCELSVPNSVACQKRHLDLLFVAVNASGKGSGRVERHNHARQLNRQEFLQVLVRIATARYVLTGRAHGVPDAVRLLVEEDVLPRIGAEMLHDLNTFRKRYCYPKVVDQVLRRHEASLRALYTEFSRGNELATTSKEVPNRKTLLAYQSLLGLDEWMCLLRCTRLLDGKRCTARHGTLAFVWSRMCVVGSENDDDVRIRTVHLQFEDFLEAIVRLSTMTGWPSDAEIDRAGYTDAGEYLLSLQPFPAVYERFVAEHAAAWDEEPRQPIDRCVDHLISWVVRVVEDAVYGTGGCVSGGEDVRLTDKEVSAFRRLFD